MLVMLVLNLSDALDEDGLFVRGRATKRHGVQVKTTVYRDRPLSFHPPVNEVATGTYSNLIVLGVALNPAQMLGHLIKWRPLRCG